MSYIDDWEERIEKCDVCSNPLYEHWRRKPCMKKKKIDESVDILFIDHPLYQITPTAFSLEIEDVVRRERLDYFDALMKLCEKYEIEYESVPKLLTKTMKEKLEMVAIERRLLKV
jgi:hypothetical protein